MAIETIGRDVEKERFTVYLPVDTAKRVRVLSGEQGKRYSKLVNDALLAYFETKEQD